ncbi:MAG: hypothetical protein LBD46_00040 [Endomicrobium sp.]|jgi:predicted RND superfamily exporter protein|nr:hypothetical protein [Endomicrobium sp.]
MPSIPAVIKFIASLAALAQPTISKFTEEAKENKKLKIENQKLRLENSSLKNQRTILLIALLFAGAIFMAEVIILVMRCQGDIHV